MTAIAGALRWLDIGERDFRPFGAGIKVGSGLVSGDLECQKFFLDACRSIRRRAWAVSAMAYESS
ncbi:MAG: hypothetical protein L0H10_15290, partial [Comamonas sp.]|nr:hypothetical protein [Comamonas sp.]